MSHPIAMASGIMPEATPVQLVEAAASAGFDFGGMWIEPDLWTDQTTRDVKARQRDTGLELIDVEVVWIKPGPPNTDHIRIIDIGAELGARNVLVVSSDGHKTWGTGSPTKPAWRTSPIGMRSWPWRASLASMRSARAATTSQPCPALGRPNS